MKLLVCGGRDYHDEARVFAVLDDIAATREVAVVITGGARGADLLAKRWAEARKVPVQEFPADWANAKPRKSAGPRRNQKIIDEGSPCRCVAFPGGSGTSDMVGRCRRAGIPVVEVPR